MSTVGELLDRLYRTYLEPPDARPIEIQLTGPLTADAADNILTVSGFVVPEDADLLKVGTILEHDQELMQVISYDLGTSEVGVVRGFLSTPLTSYGTEKVVGKLAPSYPRSSVFEAVADNIIQLYPKLYSVNTVNLVPIQGNIYGIGDTLAVEVLEMWRDGSGGDVDFDARMVDYHPAVGGRAVISNVFRGGAWIKYRRRFGKATAETDTLASLGVDERWVAILMAGAAADLMAGRDVPAAHTEWVSATLEAESIQVGTRSSVAVGLARYRELLITRAESEMSAEYRPKVHMRSPWKQVVR
jgi:hypothetical protein